MSKGSWSVCVSCLFGAFIGALVALEISTRFEYGEYFWPVGALIGAMTAYLVVDIKQLRSGLKHSWQRTITWRPCGLFWKAMGANFLASFSLSLSSLLFLGLITSGMYMSEDYLRFFLAMVSWMAFSVGSINALIFSFDLRKEQGEENTSYEMRLHREIGNFLYYAWYGNPIAFAIYAVYLTIFTGRFIFSHRQDIAEFVGVTIPKVARTVIVFIVGVFLCIHSQKRVICFVDAALGTAIGYATGSAIIGAIAGGLLGIVNYELVSIRWLKLIPANGKA